MYRNKEETSHFVTACIINPRHTCAARVTVVGLCVGMYVCVCVCVRSNLTPHIGITKGRHHNTGTILNFNDFA